MKKIINTIFISLSCFFTYSQTGINNSYPLEVFHIDGKGDNPNNSIPNKLEQRNDVLIDKKGNIGVGTINPDNKLVIENENGLNTGLTLPNHASEGRILTSDNHGNGSWKVESNVKVILGERDYKNYPQGIDLPIESQDYYYTGWFITLPPGKWEVVVNMATSFDYTLAIPEGISVWLRSTFRDTTITGFDYSTSLEYPMLISTTLSGPKNANTTKYVINYGSIVINNTSSVSKKYYYSVGYTNFLNKNTLGYKVYKYGDDLGANIIYAIAIN